MDKKKIKKRGATHVDWIMSIGIFLIYILTLFIIIKPGFKEIYNRDTLLFILEDNFKNNVSWAIKETPLFMKSACVKSDDTTPQIKLEILVSDWKFSKVDPIPEENYTLSDYSFLLSDESVINKRNYFLTYYPTTQNPSRPNLKLEFRPTQSCDVELGVTEEIEGLSAQWLDNLKNANYEDLKLSWNYPVGNDFVIYLDYDNDKVYEEKIITDAPEPPQQADVFVKELKGWELKDDGNRSEVGISLRVWSS